jgi:CSLREA domain-containing protein
MKPLNTLLGNGFNLGTRGLLAAALALATLGLAAAPAAAATVVVNTTTDQSLGNCSSSCSLRDAVATAAPGDTVQIPAGHYLLTRGFMLIQKSLTFTGAGARTTVIDGNASSGIFIFFGSVNVEFDDLSLVNGKLTSGAAVTAYSFTPALLALTIRRCTFADNQTSFQGAALDLQLVDLTIEDSTFSNNHSAQSSGGAISANQSRGSIVNSTFSGNTAVVGGALRFGRGPVATSLSLINNTFTANQGTGSIGGIAISIDQLTLSNNIIAGNVGGDCSLTASIVTDHNLDSDNTCHLTGPGDLPGTNPLLGPLANNGGPTDTHALLTGSPAIDAGNNSTCPATDQRGVTRPQGPFCDMGAYELIPPPNCSNAVASPNLLWPPNHRFVPIQISGVTNPAGGALTISVTSIFQDEPVNSPGSGNTSPDATGVGTATPSVRAERDGGGDGRVYHITFTATNGNGASCTGSVTVGVPHDQGHNGGPVDQGSLYDSTLP